MLPYLLILAFISIWILLEDAAIGRKSFWTPLLTLSLFSGVRSYQVGTDSVNYTRAFREQMSTYSFRFNENVEYGYQLLQYTLLNFTYNYFWLFFLSAFFIVFSFLTIIKRYSINYWLSVYLYLTLGSYAFFFNILRQGIAVSITLFAIPYLLEKKLVKFICIILVASQFHISSLALLPFYFIVNSNFRLLYKTISIFLSSLVGSQLVVFYLASTNPRYREYTEVYEAGSGLVTMSFYTSLVILLYLTSIIYKVKDTVFLKLFTLYATGVAMVIPIALLGTNPSGPQRLLYFFTWPLIILIPITLKRINNIFITILTLLVCMVYFIITTSNFANLVPYTLNPLFKIF